ncbi:MAG: PAS domain S-box protein [Acidobacteria bacterium]|nr:PAS domain S-box protein [Acidobacteriota bacterium]MBI3657844.1 PAS domain S-box protein [Acidobacteriota bacterium]
MVLAYSRRGKIETTGKQILVGAGVTDKPESKDLLLQAFDQFTKVSGSLELSYSQLQKRAENLSIELETSNRKLTQNLEEKERVRNYLNSILESLPCGVVVVDLQGEVTIGNRLAARLLSVPEARAKGVGYSCVDLFGSHPIATHIANGLLEPNRSLNDVELEADTGGTVLAVSSSPMAGPAGDIVGVTFIIKDVTPIKKLQAQNQRAERLSAMGEMAVELAHEIRNPLASIELLASLLCKTLPAGKEPSVWAGHIRVGVRSLNAILTNMLHFSRDWTPSFQPVNLNSLIDETLGFAGPLIQARGVSLLKSYPTVPVIIPGDRELLKQMFLNLIFNALQAMPDSGILEVAVGYSGESQSAGERFLEIRIKDTGRGIPGEQLDKIFDPYFTTTKTGNGLGLAVVHRIIESHHGRIRVESTANLGTTFTIRLPIAESEQDDGGIQREQAAVPVALSAESVGRRVKEVACESLAGCRR